MICPKCKAEIDRIYFSGEAKVFCTGTIKKVNDSFDWNYDEVDLDDIDNDELDKRIFVCPECDAEIDYDSFSAVNKEGEK